MNRQFASLLSGVILLGFASNALAEGFLIVKDHPRISGVYTVLYHHVDIKVDNQVSKVQVTQAFQNPTHRTMEVEYFFPLPEDAAIDNFVMMVDGKEIPGRLMGKEEARKIYEDIVRRKKDPALMEYMGRGLFKTSVFPIPPGQQRKINVGYTKLCQRDGNTIELHYPLATERYSARPLNDLKINCRITHQQAIKSIYSPTHEINVSRPSDTEAIVSLRQHHVLPRGDFRLIYGVSEDQVGLSMLSYRPNTAEAGYFILLASPKVDAAGMTVLPKSVIFVLDKSGSMTGQKIEQAKNSLRFVLQNLHSDDTFNIITYDSDISSFQPELQKADSKSIAEALDFVSRISSGGSTNIDGALRTTMGMLTVPDRPSYVIFLTDGLPTVGEQREPAIVDNCTKGNHVRARLMAFGVGDDVNARLLDKLVAANFGDSHYVRPNEDIEGPISKLFRKLSSPVLSQLQLSFPGLDLARTFPKILPDLFKGNQLVLVGRYHQPGNTLIKLTGKVGVKEQVYTQQVFLDDYKAPYARAFIEKLWAERRVGYLIDEIDLHGQNQELVAEIVRLSTKYGILTPYTSFLADEGVRINDLAANILSSERRLAELERNVSGGIGVGQRRSKGTLKKKAKPAYIGFQSAYDFDGEETQVHTVLNVGLKTFYQKQGRWLDSTVTTEQEKRAIKLVQFSKDYFELVRRLPATMNQYFTLSGELVLNVYGQTYWVVPQN